MHIGPSVAHLVQYAEGRGIEMNPKSDLPQGTLDLLVLKIVALGRFTVTRLPNGCSRFPATWCRFRKVRCTRRCIAWRIAAVWQPNGMLLKPAEKPSSTV